MIDIFNKLINIPSKMKKKLRLYRTCVNCIINLRKPQLTIVEDERTDRSNKRNVDSFLSTLSFSIYTHKFEEYEIEEET